MPHVRASRHWQPYPHKVGFEGISVSFSPRAITFFMRTPKAGEPAWFPLWFVVASAFAAVGSLGSAWLARRHECRADRDGAALLGSFDVAARVLASESARLDGEQVPPRWLGLWSPHPPLDRRLGLLALAARAERASHDEQGRVS